MKILSILDAVGWGGTKEQAYLTAIGLKERGHDISFALSYDYHAFKQKIEDIIPYYEFEKETLLKRINISSYKRLYDIISKNQFDIVFANSPKALDYMRIVYPFLSKKPKTVAFKRSGRVSNIISKYLKYNIADKIIVVSKDVYENLLKNNFYPNRLRLIQSGIDLSRFSQATYEEKISLRKKYNIPLDKHIFINVSNYNPEIKGHIDILKAYKQIESNNTMLLFVGLLTDEDATIEAKKMGIKNFLGFGFSPTPEELLKASDTFVFGSRLEGIAGALLQAMSVGLICVSTDAGGIKEYLKHNQNGFLINIKDIGSMSFYMKKAMSLDNTTKQGICTNAINTAKEYSVNNMIDKYEKLIKELM